MHNANSPPRVAMLFSIALAGCLSSSQSGGGIVIDSGATADGSIVDGSVVDGFVGDGQKSDTPQTCPGDCVQMPTSVTCFTPTPLSCFCIDTIPSNCMETGAMLNPPYRFAFCCP